MKFPSVLPILIVSLALTAWAQQKPRARDVGVPFEGTPGAMNAITDVAGVEVGHSTLISGQGDAAIRTGVTAVWPRGKSSADSVFAGWFSLNGNGEMTGTTWVEESGFLDGPAMITNTHSVGVVRDAYIQWRVGKGQKADTWSLPLVAETYDGFLNNINAFAVKPEHTVAALEGARPGRVAEGNVGGGTGMMCYGFKGGIGTASRKAGDYTVGALVQCNCGRRPQLTIAGVPAGLEINAPRPMAADLAREREELGSIIIVIATDAPLLPQQLKRLARRATMGLARTGSTSGNGSGDIFIAFSTANPGAAKTTGVQDLKMLANDRMDPIFAATIESVEEAIVNAMVGAETMTGYQNHRVVALPHDALREVLTKYNRLRR
jgi:L-aminopeptidase/D-esterase-like protein